MAPNPFIAFCLIANCRLVQIKPYSKMKFVATNLSVVILTFANRKVAPLAKFGNRLKKAGTRDLNAIHVTATCCLRPYTLDIVFLKFGERTAELGY